ncbi:hypothetical protein PLICRDRAFT_31764 [Plicaturopsis crispa FD-325 SS-3]|nr:hypothetical protein PLICRDRAFT_31764 [Plicaturopsis crispa FD-325 SS-3]
MACMLSALPTEVVLEVLAYLDIQILCSLQSLSRNWNDFIKANESSIYRNAAILHRLLDSPYGTLSETKSLYSDRAMDGVNDWKDFCQKRLCLESGWTGKGPSSAHFHEAAGKRVHRLKVDEKVGIIITTAIEGGVVVADLYTDERLWGLSSAYVRPYAHCEYSNGYLVFDRVGGFKEVWRLASDAAGAERPTASSPDSEQWLESEASARRYVSSTTRKGHFEPWALLRLPEHGRAFRLVYPTLLVASANSAFMWDVTTGEQLTTIRDTQRCGEGYMGGINYVEVSDHYAIVCGSEKLRIFSRSDGSLLLDLSPDDLPWYTHSICLKEGTGQPLESSAVVVPQILEQAGGARTPAFAEFCAAHISPCEHFLVAVVDFGQLVVVHDLEALLSRKVQVADCAAILDLNPRDIGSSVLYLAFENGKVGFATSLGIYVVVIDREVHRPDAPPFSANDLSTLLSRLSVSRVMHFNNEELIDDLSCLQLSDTRLFFVWSSSDRTLPTAIQPATPSLSESQFSVYSIDFSPP